MTKLCSTLLGVAVAALYTVLPTASAAEIHASQTSLTWTLLDLDPTDGIAPSLRFLPQLPPGEPGTGAVGLLNTFVDGVYREMVVPGAGTDPIVASLDSSPIAAVAGRIDGRADPATHVLTLDLQAAPGTGTGMTQAFGSMRSGPLPFILSANTAVTFQSIVHLAGQIDPDPSHIELATASATLGITLDGQPPDADWLGSAAFLFLGYHPDDPTSDELTRELTIDYANRTSGDIGGNIALEAGAIGVASLVPEPGALPLTLAGVAVLGWAARRRRR